VKSFNSEIIQFIRHKENKGVAAARNTALRSATGEYIAFQDSDDEWMPDKLEAQIRAFKTSPPEVGMVYTGSLMIVNNKKMYIPFFEPKGQDRSIFNNLIRMHFVTASVLMLKRECFETAGLFDERLPVFEDWEIFIRMSKHFNFVGINKPLVMRYRQSDSLSSNLGLVTEGFSLLLEKYYHDIKQDKTLLSSCYFKLGHLFSAQGEFNQGRRYFIKSMEAYPLNIMASIAFVVSLFGKHVYNLVSKSYRLIRWWDIREYLNPNK
jgi:glycosyltransferase involved in cell wall biosynthesis